MQFQFSGVNIYSKTPEVVLAFYQKLGFRVLNECPFDDRWYGAMLALQDSADQPVIWIWRQDAEDDRMVCNHFVFSANGMLDAIYAGVTAAGIDCDPPSTAAWGGRELILQDPAGNELLFL